MFIKMVVALVKYISPNLYYCVQDSHPQTIFSNVLNWKRLLMPPKNEQLRIQDVLFFTYLKIIDIGNALEVRKERKLTILIVNLHELLH